MPDAALRHARRSPNPAWSLSPSATVHGVLVLPPAFAPPWFSSGRRTPTGADLRALGRLLSEPVLVQGVVDTVDHAGPTSGVRTVPRLLRATLPTPPIIGLGTLRTTALTPVLVSTVGAGFAIEATMHPAEGVALGGVGIDRPDDDHRSRLVGRDTGRHPSSAERASRG